MTTLFATNKTFTMTGITSDTFEPYVSVIGYHLVLCNNAFGGGTHYEARMNVISTEYRDAIIDRSVERTNKSNALAEAEDRCIAINAAYAEKEAA